MTKFYHRKRENGSSKWGEWFEIDAIPQRAREKGWYQNWTIGGKSYYLSNANIDIEMATEQFFVQY